MTGWRPASAPAAATRRAGLLARARDYFRARGVLEVDTPALVARPACDPNIDPFSVIAGDGARYYLHTSPEYCMKRLLAAGYPDIFSISRVFRDGEAGRRHLPEFTLLEWYRHGFGLADIIDDAVEVVRHCLGAGAPGGDVSVFDYRDALARFADIDVFSATAGDIADCLDADAGLRDALGTDRDAWLDLLFDSRVVPEFEPGRLAVVRHFPASKAALARLCPADGRVADRFELYCGHIELANGYVELTDAAEQRRRFESEQRRNASRGRVRPCDERLLAALEAGLPECAGVALGIERLQMVGDGAEDIADVVTFVEG